MEEINDDINKIFEKAFDDYALTPDDEQKSIINNSIDNMEGPKRNKRRFFFIFIFLLFSFLCFCKKDSHDTEKELKAIAKVALHKLIIGKEEKKKRKVIINNKKNTVKFLSTNKITETLNSDWEIYANPDETLLASNGMFFRTLLPNSNVFEDFSEKQNSFQIENDKWVNPFSISSYIFQKQNFQLSTLEREEKSVRKRDGHSLMKSSFISFNVYSWNTFSEGNPMQLKDTSFQFSKSSNFEWELEYKKMLGKKIFFSAGLLVSFSKENLDRSYKEVLKGSIIDTVNYFDPIFSSIDSDNDGIYDQHDLDNNGTYEFSCNGAGTLKDTDGDGYSDWFEEFIAAGYISGISLKEAEVYSPDQTIKKELKSSFQIKSIGVPLSVGYRAHLINNFSIEFNAGSLVLFSWRKSLLSNVDSQFNGMKPLMTILPKVSSRLIYSLGPISCTASLSLRQNKFVGTSGENYFGASKFLQIGGGLGIQYSF